MHRLESRSIGVEVSERNAFVHWARRSRVPLRTVHPDSGTADLTALGEMIGDATVVALGEGDHFGAEPMLFRNRLFQYLVEEKGFTAIALESGITESRVVHDYVRGAPGDLRQVVSRGISWTFDRAPQNESLIRWLRQHNARPQTARKVDFYGFDVPGSPGNPHAMRGMETALQEVLGFLERVDTVSASVFDARLRSLLPQLRFDRYRPESAGYHRLSAAERDTLTAAVADLRALMEARERLYTEASSAADYAWALRASIGAGQVDEWLRQIPLDWQGSTEQLRFLDQASELRDRAQADNLEWIVRQVGPAGKVLIFAHNGHLSMAPMEWTWWRQSGAGEHARGGPDAAERERGVREISGRAAQHPDTFTHEVAGTYLRRRFGTRLCTIGNVIGEGRIGCEGYSRTLEPLPPGSLDGAARNLGEPLFVLDLRAAPAEAAAWLREKRALGRGFEMPGRYRISFDVAPLAAFDVLVYIDQVTPAQPV